jgi:hypothetical protein
MGIKVPVDSGFLWDEAPVTVAMPRNTIKCTPCTKKIFFTFK